MLGHVAVGTWSGGRFMHFGEPIPDERLELIFACCHPAIAPDQSELGVKFRGGRGDDGPSSFRDQVKTVVKASLSSRAW